MSFPRLYASYRGQPPVELIRGQDVTYSAVSEIAEGLSDNWDIWQEDRCQNPIGAHRVQTRHIDPTSARALALTPEERQAMPQGDYPFAINASITPTSRNDTSPSPMNI